MKRNYEFINKLVEKEQWRNYNAPDPSTRGAHNYSETKSRFVPVIMKVV